MRVENFGIYGGRTLSTGCFLHCKKHERESPLYSRREPRLRVSLHLIGLIDLRWIYDGFTMHLRCKCKE